MSIALFILIVVLSAVASVAFVARDARKFALAPPTPLIDLDRMYDVIFSQLDVATGSAVTPAELADIIKAFVQILGTRDLIREDLAPVENDANPEETLLSREIASEILAQHPVIDVLPEFVETIVEHALVYLREIRALT